MNSSEVIAILGEHDFTDAQLEVLGRLFGKEMRGLVKRQQRLTRSRRQEREGMGRFGGTPHPRSGARWDRKNDGRTDTELIEFKRTDNKQYITLRYADLRDLERNALAVGRTPVLDFELGGYHYVVVRERDYLDRARGADPGSGVSTGSDQQGPGAPAQLLRSGQVRRVVRERRDESVVRRLPAQRAGADGEVHLLRNPPGPPRCLPGPPRMPGVRPGKGRAVGRLGRVLRKGTAPDQETEAPCNP